MSLTGRAFSNRRVRTRHYPSSFRCNGVDGYIGANIDGFLTGLNSDAGSFAFYFKTQNVAINAPIFGYQKTGLATYISLRLNYDNAGVQSPGKLGMFIRDNDNAFVNQSTLAPLQFGNGRWHHLALSLTPSTNTWKLYLDSIDIGCTHFSPSDVMDAFSNPISPYFTFGALNNNGTPEQFNDISFCEILMYLGVTLTQDQITELYYEGTIPSNPFRYFKCDEGSGTVLHDSSANGVSATLVPGTSGGWATDSPMKLRTPTT